MLPISLSVSRRSSYLVSPPTFISNVFIWRRCCLFLCNRPRPVILELFLGENRLEFSRKNIIINEKGINFTKNFREIDFTERNGTLIFFLYETLKGGREMSSFLSLNGLKVVVGWLVLCLDLTMCSSSLSKLHTS